MQFIKKTVINLNNTIHHWGNKNRSIILEISFINQKNRHL
jgi:hypothetical protein